MILVLLSGAERRDVGGGRLLSSRGRVRYGGDAGEDVEAEVAAALDPLVVLLGEDGADEAGQGVAVGEDPDDVGAAFDLAVEPLQGLVNQILRQCASGNSAKAVMSVLASRSMAATVGNWCSSMRVDTPGT